MTILPSGNVGIGTTNPLTALQVGNSGNGSVATTNAWNTFSDIRLKKDLTKLPNACEMVDQLNGYYYYWKKGADKSRQVGVIAQEVEKVLPELVHTQPDGIKTVDYPKLTAVLIEAVKTIWHKVSDTDQKLAALKKEKDQQIVGLKVEKDKEIADLNAKNAALQAANAAINAQLEKQRVDFAKQNAEIISRLQLVEHQALASKASQAHRGLASQSEK